jgi:polysaccharide biosynthesis protein PelF
MITQTKPTRFKETADICLLLEGTYPYVRGGVSSWTHDLIRNHSDLTFHIVCILPGTEAPEMRYELPSNVLSVTEVFLRQTPNEYGTPSTNLMRTLYSAMDRLAHDTATLADLSELLGALNEHRHVVSNDYLLNSQDAWRTLVAMYEARYAESSMLDYFWSWRALFGSVFSVLLCPLPEAKAYHSLCTGYAGLLAARAKIEKNRPVILTEHGIYTSERRIEIASADWLEETASSQLTIDTMRSDLRDLWIDAFTNYSRICYQAADKIVTLYRGNQQAQITDGADPYKMSIIPNGVDVARFGAIQKRDHELPTIAMIGRVVPIKDVKSFIRACGILRETVGEFKAYIMGNTDEDPEYYDECRNIVEHLLLDDMVEFTGAVKIDDYLPEIDIVVFTSISEAQPLVILEVGAAGIPVVSTDVGACDEMVNGLPEETPLLGSGGAIVPLSNPTMVAEAVIRLLSNPAYYEECANAIRARVHTYYNKSLQYNAYHSLYASVIK